MYVYAWMYVYICVNMFIYIWIYVYVCMYIYIYICIHIYAHTYTYTYSNLHIYTHVHIYVLAQCGIILRICSKVIAVRQVLNAHAYMHTAIVDALYLFSGTHIVSTVFLTRF